MGKKKGDAVDEGSGLSSSEILRLEREYYRQNELLVYYRRLAYERNFAIEGQKKMIKSLRKEIRLLKSLIKVEVGRGRDNKAIE